MPVASPFLKNILTRWTDEGRQTQLHAEAAVDSTRYARQDADDARKKLIRFRLRALEEVEAAESTLHNRWVERLKRLEQWRNEVAGVREEHVRVDHTYRTMRWFAHAQAIGPHLNQHLSLMSDRIEAKRLSLRQGITDWTARLAEKAADLQAFHEKASQRTAPLLVSRARKRIDEIFVRQERLNQQILEQELEGLRLSATVMLGRIYRGYTALEKRADVWPALFEIPRRQIEQELKPAQSLLFALRERVLSDVLTFEAGRRQLTVLNDQVHAMTCVEDVYRRPAPWWRRWLRQVVRQESDR